MSRQEVDPVETLQTDDEDEYEQSLTDWEQDYKEITAEPFTNKEEEARYKALCGKNQIPVKALIIQDLKMEDGTEEGGYSRRRITEGSTVIIRGGDGEDGAAQTWKARVNRCYKQESRTNLQAGPNDHWFVEFNWLYTPNDLSEASLEEYKKRHPGMKFIPRRELLYSTHVDVACAKHIRHPCTVWLVPNRYTGNLPTMRAGVGASRHTRPRPGFIIRRVYDISNEIIYDLTDPLLSRKPIGKKVQAFLEENKALLESAQRKELRHDVAYRLEDVDRPPVKKTTDLAVDKAARQLAELVRKSGESTPQRAQQAQLQERKKTSTENLHGASTSARASRPSTSSAVSALNNKGMPNSNKPSVKSAMQRPANTLLTKLGSLGDAGPEGANRLPNVEWGKEVSPYLPTVAIPGIEAMQLLLNALLEGPQSSLDLLANSCHLVRPLIVWFMRLCPWPDFQPFASKDQSRELQLLITKVLVKLPYNPKTDRWLRYKMWKRVFQVDVRQMDIGNDVKSGIKQVCEHWDQGYDQIKAQVQSQKGLKSPDIFAMASSLNRFGGTGPRYVKTPPTSARSADDDKKRSKTDQDGGSGSGGGGSVHKKPKY